MKVYRAVNSVSGKSYFGITKDFNKRKFSHKSKAKGSRDKRGGKTPFYDAIRSYGWEKFNWYIIFEGDVKDCKELEVFLIKETKGNNYNLHKGGDIGFSMRDKPIKAYKEWKSKLKTSRKGRKPALGMKHSDENKALFAKVSRAYWNTQEVYDSVKILEYGKNYGMTKTLKEFGISKTHYYRLKKRALTNE